MSRRVLILGATSGIAQETARRFSAEHAKLLLVARDPRKLAALAEDLKIRGAESVATMQADLVDASAHARIVGDAFGIWAGLDAALIAHGTLPDQLAAEIDPSLVRQEIETNYVSVVSLLMQLSKVFEQQRAGVLCVIGSVAGDRGRRSNYLYGSAKAGVATLVAGLRVRLAAADVRVLLIKPGWVSTPMTSHLKQNFLFATAEEVGRGVYNAMSTSGAVVYLPWYWRWIMVIIRLIPEPIFAKLNL